MSGTLHSTSALSWLHSPGVRTLDIVNATWLLYSDRLEEVNGTGTAVRGVAGGEVRKSSGIETSWLGCFVGLGRV